MLFRSKVFIQKGKDCSKHNEKDNNYAYARFNHAKHVSPEGKKGYNFTCVKDHLVHRIAFWHNRYLNILICSKLIRFINGWWML